MKFSNFKFHDLHGAALEADDFQKVTVSCSSVSSFVKFLCRSNRYSVVFTWSCKQTDRQTEKQIDKRGYYWTSLAEVQHS